MVSEHRKKHYILRKENDYEVVCDTNTCWDENHDDDQSAEGYNHFSKESDPKGTQSGRHKYV